MRSYFLVTVSLFMGMFLLSATGCKDHCSTCFYINDTVLGTPDSVKFQEACGSKRELEVYEDSSKQAGVVVGKTVTCIRDMNK